MSFIDIKDPAKRDQIVADYVATIRRVQQRNEDEKSAGLAKQAELERTFNPVVKATQETTRAITEHLNPIHDELKVVAEKLDQAKTAVPRRKRIWDDETGSTAIDYYLNHEKNLDRYYGIKEEDGNLVLGNKQVLVDENSDITIDDQTYVGTPGLWAMIMLASPPDGSYTDADEQAYSKLIAQTDLLKRPRDVKPNSRPQSTIKRKMMDQLNARYGRGVAVFLPGDIKGLSTKLNLLLAEFRAGNTSTRNEIVSILDELSRRKRISRKEYTEINNFLQQ